MFNILVAYATKHQSTAEIARVIWRTLRHFDELNVDLLAADEVRSIIPYDAVVLGSAVYIGQWRPEAVNFLKRFEQPLSNCPLWLFSSGPTGEGTPEELVDNWHYPHALEPLIRTIRPREAAVFHGKLELNKLNSVERHAIEASEIPVGDFRNWNMICTWAERIGRDLSEETIASRI